MQEMHERFQDLATIIFRIASLITFEILDKVVKLSGQSNHVPTMANRTLVTQAEKQPCFMRK